MQPIQPEVSIIIVNYNTADLLRDCIQSIFDTVVDVTFEIIVVDNDSKDNSQEIVRSFPKVLWLQSGYNAGFSRANNLGIRNASGNYILILNSDTKFYSETLFNSLAYHKKKERSEKVGITTCHMINHFNEVLFNSNLSIPYFEKIVEANALVIFLKKLVGFKKNDEHEKRLLQHHREHQTCWIGGAFALLNRKLFTENNLWLDEDFFMYGEDIEWCNRISKAGFNHYFHMEARVLHLDGGSPSVSDWKQNQVLISSWLCVRKVYGRSGFVVYSFMLIVNLVLDELLYQKAGVLKNDTLEQQSAKTQRKSIFSLWKNYFAVILFQYSGKASTAKFFLKYAA